LLVIIQYFIIFSLPIFAGAQPLDPPAYTAPSHQPPAYDVAMKESVVVPSNFHGDIRHIRGKIYYVLLLSNTIKLSTSLTMKTIFSWWCDVFVHRHIYN